MKKLLLLITIISMIFIGCKQPTEEIAQETETETYFSIKGIDITSEADIDKIIPLLSNAEKAGQMLQAERNGITIAEIVNFNIGSILSGGGSTPIGNTPTDWVEMYNEMQLASRNSSSQIPLVYGIDAVHGHNNVKGAVIFPHNIGLGAANNAALMEEMGRMVAKEIHATGLNWNFAPAVSVVQDIRWGRSYESFSENPALAAPLGAAYVTGLEAEGIMSTTKHFIGDGLTDQGDDQGDVIVGDSELQRINLPVYEAAITAGTKSIMATYNSVDGAKVHGSTYYLTTVLRDTLGFEGLIVSDWNGVDQVVGGDLEASVIQAINAGIDLLMQPHSWEAVYNIILANMGSAIPMSRINDAVKRNLIFKYQAGLFTDDYLKTPEAVGSAEVRAVARDLVAESMVLLKNDTVGAGPLLPLAKSTNIYLTGPAANDLGVQCGGWTIGWQGTSDSMVVGGTSLREAIIAAGGTLVTTAAEADVVILAIGESSYAEGDGDEDGLNPLSIIGGNNSLGGNEAAIDAAEASGKPVVTIIMAGRPLLIEDYVDNWDALVMAWLPGSEGLGMTDVLFGDKPFTGTLPVTWPNDIDDADDSIMMDTSMGGTATYTNTDYRFPYGYSFP
ncbi:MAG: glycoside hydrolase family 3 protein [Spirochaetaceae bacterium]|nr:glycoside hydrolase family 3 protein [Spirochaetaceae bacterium]